jgi:capsular exopolysaccharide synthesis family protein
MSRIDEALNRARGSASTGLATDAAILTPYMDGVPTAESKLDHYPTERVELPRPRTSSVRPSEVSVVSRVGRLREATPGSLADRFGTGAERFVISPGARSELVEEYRTFAATLIRAQEEHNVRVIMMTSALSAEGKTYSAANLALTLSESYQQSVLVIDADLRRPTMHTVFDVANESGLSDGLRSGEPNRIRVVRLTANLALLPAGNPGPNPTAILSSPAMKLLLKSAAVEYRWVIVDTPPIALLPDAHLLASIVHATVLVVRAGSTPCRVIQGAIESLGRDRLMGVVLNRAEGPRIGRSYY